MAMKSDAPFHDAKSKLLEIRSQLKKWTEYREKVDLICRVATILLQTHHHQLISTPSARPLLCDLKDVLHARVKECKDTFGFNLAAMDHLKQLMAMKSDAPFRDAKSELFQIRSQLSKLNDARAEETRAERMRKKQQKKEND